MEERGKISWLIFNVLTFHFVIYIWYSYYLENVSEGETGGGRGGGREGRERERNLNFSEHSKNCLLQQSISVFEVENNQVH